MPNATKLYSAKEIMESTKGKIFFVEFTKRSTGETRRMTARLGVSRDITGIGMAYDPKSKNLLVVYDMDKNAYRMVNLDTVTAVSFGGKRWEF